MRILEITLQNFKGIRLLTLGANGCDVDIYGDNGTGKTTIADAYYWGMIDRDSLDQAEFPLQTVDAAGVPVSAVEPTVTLKIEHDGQERQFVKAFAEKWTKRRGEAEATLTGHGSKCWVDSRKVKKRQYDQAIKEIIEPEVFRLLTNPTYFCQSLNWKARRELLLKVCGDLTDHEIVESNDGLERYAEILGIMTDDEKRSEIAERKSKINEELEELPPRIDEVGRGLPEMPQGHSDLEERITSLRSEQDAKRAERVAIEEGGVRGEKERKLKEAREEAAAARRRMDEDHAAALRDLERRATDADDKLSRAKGKLEARNGALESAQDRLREIDQQLLRLRSSYRQAEAQRFPATVPGRCPACGEPMTCSKCGDSSLAEEAGKEYSDKLREYNEERAAVLDSIDKEGMEKKCALDAQARQVAQIEGEIVALTAEVGQHEKEKAGADAALETARTKGPPKKSLELLALEDAILALEAAIGKIDDTDDRAAIEALDDEIAALDGELEALEAARAQVQQRSRGLRRIEELEGRERELAGQFEALERDLAVLDCFIAAKVDMMDERINSHFRYARFKMFVQHINGAIEPCCDVLVAGVPYSTALNSGAKVNVGLDVINALSRHFGIAPPVFLDGAEGVTEPLATEGQQIRLHVSAGLKELKIVPKLKGQRKKNRPANSEGGTANAGT